MQTISSGIHLYRHAPDDLRVMHTGNYTAPNWRDAIPLRPGALDHEKHGSRQADGCVKPFTRIGYLSSKVRGIVNDKDK